MNKYKKAREEFKKNYEDCSKLIEIILSNSDELTINDHCIHDADVDDLIIRGLEAVGLKQYIAHDVSGYKALQGAPVKVLLDLAQEERIFRNNGKKFIIRENYAVHSVRYFTAEKVEKNRRKVA
jgi:hypothetical protein